MRQMLKALMLNDFYLEEHVFDNENNFDLNNIKWVLGDLEER